MQTAKEILTFTSAAAVVVAITLGALGLLGYLLAGSFALLCGKSKGGMRIRRYFLRNPAANIGIPCSALASFLVVAIYSQLYEPTSQGQLEVTIFGLQFTGPSGPISLWVLCFLSFILAIRMLSLKQAPEQAVHTAAPGTQGTPSRR